MRWDAVSELGSARGLAFLFWIYRLLGRWPFRLAAFPVVLWFLAFKPLQRLASRSFLSRALKRPASPADCFRHFFGFSEAILDKLIAWNRGFALTDVEFHGRELIEQALAGGRGCVLIGSHLGNLEIGRVLARLRPGLELHVLMHTRHAANFNRILKQLDPSNEVNLHQAAELDAGLAAWLSRRVELGAVVVMTGDRVPVAGGRRVSAASFLGARAEFPQGPYFLAAALGCPVFLVFCLRRGLGRKGFSVHYEPFAERLALPREGRERALQALVERYAARLEYFCGQAPYQWYNFYPFWLENPDESP